MRALGNPSLSRGRSNCGGAAVGDNQRFGRASDAAKELIQLGHVDPDVRRPAAKILPNFLRDEPRDGSQQAEVVRPLYPEKMGLVTVRLDRQIGHLPQAVDVPFISPSITKTGLRIECSQTAGERMAISCPSSALNGNLPCAWPVTLSAGPNEKTARNRSLDSATRRARVPPVLCPPR